MTNRSNDLPLRTRQRKACPWRKDVVAARDIPGGYCPNKHAALSSTIAEPGALNFSSELRFMACHESDVGAEVPCVGWLVNQLGPGNNIALRFRLLGDKRIAKLKTFGEQHERLEDALGEER